MQEMTSSVPPLRAVYKTSCWPPYWRLAREALTCNWPSICFEGHPPITGAHKRGGIKPTCTWASRETDWGWTALLLMPLISLQGGAHPQKPLSMSAHLVSPASVRHLFKYPPSWLLNQGASEPPRAIIKEKVTSSNNLLIGFGSFLTSQVLSVADVLVWGITCCVFCQELNYDFLFCFEEPYLWFWILKLINYNLQTLYSTADYFHTKLLEWFPTFSYSYSLLWKHHFCES